MSVATGIIPHRKPEGRPGGLIWTLHRKLVEGRAGYQRCKQKKEKRRRRRRDEKKPHKATLK